MRVYNFLFHRVCPVRDPLWDPLSPAAFDRILGFLTRRFSVNTLEDLALGRGEPEGHSAQKDLCTIGFDDGYRDNIEYALPILRKHRCPASFYVVTDCIDQNRPTWTYEVDYLIRNTRARRLDFDCSALPEPFRTSTLEGSTVRLRYARLLKPAMKRLSNVDRTAILEQLLHQTTDVSLPRDLMMSWHDVRALATAGYPIGSHSKTHPMLAALADRDSLREELCSSRDRIAAEIGEAPEVISYPIGSVSDSVVEASRRCGYRVGLATGQRPWNHSPGGDLFRIPRIELYNEPWIKTRMRITGSLERVKSWIRR